MRDGVPFFLDIPDKLATRDSITQAEFDTMMQIGLALVNAIQTDAKKYGEKHLDGNQKKLPECTGKLRMVSLELLTKGLK